MNKVDTEAVLGQLAENGVCPFSYVRKIQVLLGKDEDGNTGEQDIDEL